MKCRLCKYHEALVKAKVGKAIIEVCLYCAITEKLEVVEVLNVWEVKERLEEGDKGKSEL